MVLLDLNMLLFILEQFVNIFRYHEQRVNISLFLDVTLCILLSGHHYFIRVGSEMEKIFVF